MNSTQIDLLDIMKKGSYEHGVIFSYEFSPLFFEDYCLNSLNTLGNVKNLSVVIDKKVYEKIITSKDIDDIKEANIRYLLQPARVQGVFHPKLYLFASKKKGKLFIGSANLTKSGLSTNAEIMGCYEFDLDKDEIFKPLFNMAYKYIDAMTSKIDGNSNLKRNLNYMVSEAKWLIDEETVDLSHYTLLNNIEKPIWNELLNYVSSPVDNINILSLYFDSNPSILDRIIKDLSPQKVNIYTQNYNTTITPNWFEHNSITNKTTSIFKCDYKDDDVFRMLHGKAISIEKSGKIFFLFGSANFTQPALIKTIDNGNAEIMLLIKDINKEDFDVKSFFDPDNTATILNNDNLVVNEDNADIDRTEGQSIDLIEATCKDSFINLEYKQKEDCKFDEYKAIIVLSATQIINLLAKKTSETELNIELKEKTIKNISNSTSKIRIDGYKDNQFVESSNYILITNLQDVNNLRSTRRSRMINEAQESIELFINSLNEVTSEDNLELLKEFLQYCNIPLDQFIHSFFRKASFSTIDDDRGMRSLGTRNFYIAFELHTLINEFIKRHTKKLNKLIKNPSAKQIDNFLHILMAILALINKEINRLIIALDCETNPIPLREWYDIKKYLNSYYATFSTLLNILCIDYIKSLEKTNSLEDIQKAFNTDLNKLFALINNIIRSYTAFVKCANKTRVIDNQNQVKEALILSYEIDRMKKKYIRWEKLIVHFNNKLCHRKIKKLAEL